MCIPIFAACQDKKMPVSGQETVQSVDIERYLGKWYEMARFPHKFEKDMVGVTATYTLRGDGKIDVLNAGYIKTLDGPLKEARGVGKIPDKNDASKLKVSFFLFFYADYFILELDTVKYQYALVGSSSDKYLWILSRSPLMKADTYSMLVEKARERGYQVESLIRVEQKPLAEFEEGKTL
jgi:apolipoprotein D and lipocalin family protein